MTDEDTLRALAEASRDTGAGRSSRSPPRRRKTTATRACKYCQHPVAPNAKRCPSCGGKHPYPIKMEEALAAGCVLVAIVLGVVLVWSLSGEGGLYVTRADLGEQWPLTVESGTVDCIDGICAVFRHNGTTYALNGVAISRGYPEIDPIWKDKPGHSEMGWKMNIAPLTELALQQCDQ